MENDEEIQSSFEKAAAHLPQVLAKISVSDADLLYLYARFKQSTEGQCNTKRPSFIEFQARKKWDAWNALQDVSQEEARFEYVNKIKELDPEYQEANAPKGAASWVSVSSMAGDREVIPPEKKTIFDWCRDGDLAAVKRFLTPSNIDKTDEIGLTLLHWACDRGHLNIAQLLIKNKADINITDSEGQTPLHYACACGHQDIAKFLLDNRADLRIKDNMNETALSVTEDQELRKLLSSWVFWRGSGESVQ